MRRCAVAIVVLVSLLQAGRAHAGEDYYLLMFGAQ